ncbi:MAG: ribonuclease III [Oscillospiraceae bacterium]|nr:ribonuclease III [Oscillospiraceae bacterium]
MTETEKKIGHEFKDKRLLKTALTHSSYANENHTKNNERLEFLGDSVLSVIISDYIFKKMQKVDEGDLSRFRATLVCEASLAEVAKKIHLSELVFLGRGEDMTGGRKRPSVISDAFEAVLGAIYLDAGIETARAWLLNLMTDRIELVLSGGLYSDYKTVLQEWVQRDGKSAVTYSTIKETGAEHIRRFTVQVEINGEPQATASGHSKKDAEQKAAKILLERLKK